ncbi:MAG TPA: FecR domain-containing protein [Pyrinomonadaceae bacterium]|nr:FecR domain-containing protein [Pyrinomonadaceae bacterium]
MFSNHVSNLSSAYLHSELAPEQSRRFAEHMIGCSPCREEFEDVRLGANLAGQLQLVSAPESLWPRIAARLDGPATTSSLYKFWRPLAIAASIVLLAGAGLVLLRRPPANQLRPTASQQTGWQVARLGGAPRVGSESIGEQGRLGIGQWLETDSVSRANLEVAGIGNVEIDPNTRVRLLQTAANEHRLELARGRLSAHISAPPKLFFVNTPSGVAEDLGCAYTLEVDDRGNSLLHVTLGWVSMQLNGRESAVPAGAACATRTGVGPGTPYFEDATANFRAALTKVDFDSSSPAQALETVLAEARQRDAMTLWYLLSRVEPASRATVYDRLAGLVPPPRGTTREGLLSLNGEMLRLWREEIDKSHGLNPFVTVHSTLRRIWAGTLGRIHGLQGKR